MKKRGKRMACAALLLGMMGGSCALADTPQEIAQAARERWQETISACGREIAIDVQIEAPDVEQIGMYHVTAVQGSEWEGEYVINEEPEKRRGIAYRAKPQEVFTPETCDPDYHAFSHPASAGEVLARAQALMEPYLVGKEGLEAEWKTLTGSSPQYIYNKNTGEWGDTVIEGACGNYRICYAETLFGVPVDSYMFGDYAGTYDRHWEEHIGIYSYTPDFSAVYCEEASMTTLSVTVPLVQETLAKSVDLMPLEQIKDALRGLAQEGLLRQVDSMSLRLVPFSYRQADDDDFAAQEAEAVYLLKPVWVCSCEIYRSAEEEMYVYYGETYDVRYRVLIDAKTGELLDTTWILQP